MRKPEVGAMAGGQRGQYDPEPSAAGHFTQQLLSI